MLPPAEDQRLSLQGLTRLGHELAGTLAVDTAIERVAATIDDLLHPDRFWLRDGDTRVPLRPVDPEHNARTPRRRGPCPDRDAPKTGFNPVEDLLRRFTRPKDRKDSTDA